MRSRLLSTAINTLSIGHLKYGWYSSDFVSDEAPIVIGGCSRSGTTLMYTLLNAHPDIYIGLEAGLFTGNRDLDHLARSMKMDRSTIEKIYRKSRCFPEFTQNLLTFLMREAKKTRWGDKSPVNVTLLSDIFRYFPKSRFIHMIRDGRDTVCSLRKHTPAFYKRGTPNIPEFISWENAIERWDSRVRAGLCWRNDTRYHEIKYEDLVRDPDVVLQKLFAWLSMKWEPQLRSDAQRSDIPTHPGVAKPINNSAISRWQTDLPPEARHLFRGQAGELLIELGYARDLDWTT